MTCLYHRIALALCLVTLNGSSFAQATSIKFSASGSLMAGPSPEAGFASCQPLRGDLADIAGQSQKIYGTEIEVLPVRVSSGRCAGTTGWAGISSIAAVSGATSSDAVQFREPDTLFEMVTPQLVKASCQPLRGDSARILETARFFVTSVHRVQILSGRCQGKIGWAGVEQIERIAAAR